jgi:hypothetical protein
MEIRIANEKGGTRVTRSFIERNCVQFLNACGPTRAEVRRARPSG